MRGSDYIGGWPLPRVPDPLATPKVITFAGDWHADLDFALDAVREAAARHTNVILHTGDFGYLFRERFLRELNTELESHQIPILFVDGNHDNHRWLARKPLAQHGLRPLTSWIWHIPRGTRWVWDDVTFAGLGGAHSIDCHQRRLAGDMWQPEERITPAQAAAFTQGGLIDVLISHDRPAGAYAPGREPGRYAFTEIMKAEEHRELMRNVVAAVQPKMIWHGHYHERYLAEPDFGYGRVEVNGLDCNGGKLIDNLDTLTLTEIKAFARSGAAA